MQQATDIIVGKSRYKISCPENERAKLLELAAKIDDRVKKITESLKIDEKTALLIAAINIENELENRTKKEIEDAVVQDEKLGNNDMYEILSENIMNITSYIESLAKKVDDIG